MTVYKLTNQNMQTYGGCQWVIGEEKTTSGKDKLCSSGWLHCYSDPLLAVMLNPIHGNYKYPKLFEAEAGGREKHNHGLKSGYTKMTLVKELPVPEVTLIQRVAFGILCVMNVITNLNWRVWAEGWLSGKDRTYMSASGAAWAAWAAESAAAADAAWSAARAAMDATWSADASAAGALAVEVAADAAGSAALAVACTAKVAVKAFDLIALARKAMEVV